MSSSSSSISTAVEEAKFIGSIMAKMVAYYQYRLDETSCARSKPRKSQLHRNHEAEHNCLIEDYFVDDAICDKMDAMWIKAFSPIQKCTTAIRQQRYFRKPTINDIHQLCTVHEGMHGFPGMLGSIDCMHWGWSLCPNAWHVGANNDINVLDQLPVFNDIYLGKSHDVYLFKQMGKKFKEVQESARKDVEQTFGVLNRRWQVLAIRARSYEVKMLQHVMYECIILHNMIFEDEGRGICRYNENEVFPDVEGVVVGTQEYRANKREVHNHDIHHILRADLVEYIYRAHIQPPIEFSRDDLFDESDKDSNLFFESEDSDYKSDVQENEKEYEDDNSE
ncbi:uncharacterized protein LOC128127733 [Lactuca sativa]|uniref:uncharacterized protein LOC128127733 n=1 Tax=Lactuca sativa TaxID=4236 RepID=UPI0022AF793B|nr:uncharacterized protein LOC128127733 [Lactuca sativa]